MSPLRGEKARCLTLFWTDPPSFDPPFILLCIEKE